MTIPLARRILLILPLSYVLPQYWGVISIIWAGPIADAVVSVIILGLLRKSFREMRDGSFSKDGFLPQKSVPTTEVATEK